MGQNDILALSSVQDSFFASLIVHNINDPLRGDPALLFFNVDLLQKSKNILEIFMLNTIP